MDRGKRDYYDKIHKIKTDEQKKDEIEEYAKKHKLIYKEGWLYCYRNHNNKRGKYNSATYYEAGKSYRDWHCDHNPDNENSFGLGVFTIGNTPIKVQYKDWGCAVNRGDGKARVWEFTVLGK